MAKRDGIPLYAVPRMSTVLELVEADNGASRREILVKYQESIFEDCENVLGEISSEYAVEKKFFILAGLKALKNGHVEAAQALFTNTLDTVHQNFWGPDKQKRTVISNHKEGDELPQLIKNMNFLDMFVFAPIWNSHMKFLVMQVRNLQRNTRVMRVFMASRIGSINWKIVFKCLCLLQVF